MNAMSIERDKWTTTFRCPEDSRGNDDVVGCGHVFKATPDHEGLIDCPNCGMWFKPRDTDVMVFVPKP